jgi:hypothetical protein
MEEDDIIPNIEVSLKITDISDLCNPFVQYNNCLISKQGMIILKNE